MPPHPLAPVIAEVRSRSAGLGAISLFLDFDGTLVPIVADPGVPRIDPGMAETLRRVAGLDRLTVTIISGRAVEDLYSRVRLQGLIYAGNHGLEIFGRDLRFVEPVASAAHLQLERLCDELAAELRPVQGVIVEFKGLTCSVHYRQADPSELRRVREAVVAAVAQCAPRFRINSGKKVFEIVPRTDWHKGAAVHWINNRIGGQPCLSIYAGDDTSDEDAFRALPDAVTIKVGAVTATRARYQLPDPDMLHHFLLWLAARQTGEPAEV